MCIFKFLKKLKNQHLETQISEEQAYLDSLEQDLKQCIDSANNLKLSIEKIETDIAFDCSDSDYNSLKRDHALKLGKAALIRSNIRYSLNRISKMRSRIS